MMGPEAFEELKKYMDEVVAKSHGTRLVLVGKTVPVPSQMMPGHPEYVKIGFFDERPAGKNRLDFTHELMAELNILIGEVKAAYVQTPSSTPSAPPTRPAPAKPPAQAPMPPTPQPQSLEQIYALELDRLPWSDPNEKLYQWCYREETEKIPALNQFIAEMDQMTQRWRKCGAYSYIISGDNRDLLGRIPFPPRGGK